MGPNSPTRRLVFAVHEWNKTWDLIASLDNLRELQVFVQSGTSHQPVPPMDLTSEEESEGLDALTKVRQTTRFTVLVPWEEPRDSIENEIQCSRPFRIEHRP